MKKRVYIEASDRSALAWIDLAARLDQLGYEVAPTQTTLAEIRAGNIAAVLVAPGEHSSPYWPLSVAVFGCIAQTPPRVTVARLDYYLQHGQAAYMQAISSGKLE